MSQKAIVLTTKELTERVAQSSLQFKEDEIVDISVLKMRCDLRKRNNLAKKLENWIKDGHCDELVQDMAEEYNDLLAVDYDEDTLEEELGSLLDRYKDTNMSDEEYEKETEALLERIVNIEGVTPEEIEETQNDVRNLIMLGKKMMYK